MPPESSGLRLKVVKDFNSDLTDTCDLPIPGISSSIPSNSWYSHSSSEPISNIKIQYDLPLEPPGSTLRPLSVRLKLSKDMRDILRHSFFVCRYLYNACVQLCCRGPIENRMKPIIKDLRHKLITDKRDDLNILPPHLRENFKQVPNHIRNSVIRDFVTAYKINTDLIKSGKRKHFKMKYRTQKHSYHESIVIEAHDIRDIKNKSIKCFPRLWGGRTMGIFGEEFPREIKHDCRLIRTKDDKYYLSIPVEREVKPKKLKYNACALDPGERVFQCVYGSDGSSHLIGQGDSEKIEKLWRIAQRMRWH